MEYRLPSGGSYRARLSPDGTQVALWNKREGFIAFVPVPDRLDLDALLSRTGASTNMRVCRSSLEVVPVVPYPEPHTVWAPDWACEGADAR